MYFVRPFFFHCTVFFFSSGEWWHYWFCRYEEKKKLNTRAKWAQFNDFHHQTKHKNQEQFHHIYMWNKTVLRKSIVKIFISLVSRILTGFGNDEAKYVRVIINSWIDHAFQIVADSIKTADVWPSMRLNIAFVSILFIWI